MVYLAAIGWPEWLLIFAGVLLLFGARKIPDLARSLGASINEFKKGMKEGVDSPDGTGAGAAPKVGEKKE